MKARPYPHACPTHLHSFLYCRFHGTTMPPMQETKDNKTQYPCRESTPSVSLPRMNTRSELTLTSLMIPHTRSSRQCYASVHSRFELSCHMRYLSHWATTQGEVGVEFECACRQMQRGMSRTQRQGTILWAWVGRDVGSDTPRTTPISNA